jgi:TP901 family phage tail tape measure protein
MADNLTSATIDVRANTRGLEKDILKALKTVEFSEINTKRSSQALGRITGQVSEFNKSLEASNARVVAFGASAGAIFAVERALGSLISSTTEVEKKLTDINVLLNLSTTQLEKFGGSLFDVARNTSQSFSAVADAAGELARQGLGIEETLKRTNAALILTRLSGMDAKDSVEALTSTLNSFSGTALDAVEVVNKLANVDAAFAVSSADLANAISRVGSTAQDAGVSLDELIALVTSAQQTTARGGSVIGNSFKTIFTRLERGKVQDLLKTLGIDTGEGQSAISLLSQLASVYDTLGAAQKSAVAEQVGGVFQINILRAALGDLGKEYSIYGQALKTSLTSTDEAIRRNELLNKTVAALSSQTVTSLQQAADKIGSIVFAPNAKTALSGFNKILESFNNLDSESAGGKLMEGFFTGVGNFISGPGAVLATAVLVKLFAKLSQFASGSVRELLGRNEASKQQVALEQSVLAILQKNSQFTNQILSGKMTTVQAEKQLLDYLTAQSNILREQERLSKSIGANLGKAGVSVGTSGIPMVAATRGKKAAASGFVPNFASDQVIGQAMENAGAREHGYTAGRAKKTTIHDGNGKSFKSFVNNKENVKTFTNAAGKKATVVRPPNGFGENTQYAAGGYIPNFVKNQTSIRAGVDFEKRLNKSLKGTASFSPNAPMDFPLPEGYGADNKVKSALGISGSSIYGDAKISRSRKSEQSLLDKYLRTAEGQADFLSSKETKKGFINLNPKGLSMLFSQSGADARGVAYISTLNKSLSAGAQNLIKTKFGKSKKSRTLAMPYIADKINTNALSALSSGYVPNFASMGSKFKAMYGGGTTMRAVDKEKTAKKKNLDVKKLDLSDRYTMVHGGNQGLESANVSLEAGNKLFDARIATAGLNTAGTNLQKYGIKGLVGDALVGATNNIIKTFGGTEQITDVSSLDNAGSVGSAAGTVFETALRKAFNAPAVSQTQRIDFPAPTPELKKFFHNAPGQYEAKISRTPDNLKSALKKWVDVNGLASSASGFVPNFAKSGLSFSHKDKDEFGFSEIQAIMSGKKVGSFSYAEDKKGLLDVGDFLVNKSERGKGIGTELYKEAIRRNTGKKMKGQLLPQMNRLLQKIKNGEPVSAETLYPQIKRADLAKSSVFEVYGHKGMTVEKMTRDQFSSFVNAKINELKKDPKKLQSFFGNVEADEYGGLGVDLQTQHASGFVPNFLDVKKDSSLPFGVRGRANFSKPGSKPNIQLGVGATPDTLFHEASHLAYSKSTMSKAASNQSIGKFISEPKKYAGVSSIMASSIFKNVNQNELFKSLGLNPVQLDFDGRNPGAKYSGPKAIDEITTRIQEKIYKNKGDLASLSEGENAFIKNIEGLGIISNKRMSNVSRRSAEGSKFRSLIEGRFSSAMGGAAGGFVPNFAAGGRTFNKYASSIGSKTMRVVHPLKPVIGADGSVSFPVMPGKHGGATIFHREAPFGQDKLTVQDFQKLYLQRKKDPRFWERNSFEYINNAAGFIPNFSAALNDAIAREQSSGLSKSQIYVDSHSSLKNKNNPMGLMVANTRDEPSGGIQGIKRAKKEGRNPKTYGGGMSAGFVPNFAAPANGISGLSSAAAELKNKIQAINGPLSTFTKNVEKGAAVVANKNIENKVNAGADIAADNENKKPGKLGKLKEFASNNALSIGFGAQAAGDIAAKFAGQESDFGKALSVATSGLGTFASFASTGSLFGPWGTAIGAAVGATVAITDGIKAYNTKLPELTKASEAASEAFNKFSESGQSALGLSEKYAELRNSTDPNAAAQLIKIQEQ